MEMREIVLVEGKGSMQSINEVKTILARVEDVHLLDLYKGTAHFID